MPSLDYSQAVLATPRAMYLTRRTARRCPFVAYRTGRLA
jgi:hypothetical protein